MSGWLLVALALCWLALSGAPVAERHRHRVKHLFGLNGGAIERKILAGGCEWIVFTCDECGEQKNVGHAVYCPGCGRHPS
jgi:hypothetical protein